MNDISSCFNIAIHVNRTSELMPEPHQLVIVDGGVAVWTGSVWLSKIDDCRVIEWPVKWWTPLLHDNEIRTLPDATEIQSLRNRIAELEETYEQREQTLRQCVDCWVYLTGHAGEIHGASEVVQKTLEAVEATQEMEKQAP